MITLRHYARTNFFILFIFELLYCNNYFIKNIIVTIRVNNVVNITVNNVKA